MSTASAESIWRTVLNSAQTGRPMRQSIKGLKVAGQHLFVDVTEVTSQSGGKLVKFVVGPQDGDGRVESWFSDQISVASTAALEDVRLGTIPETLGKALGQRQPVPA